MHVVITGANRGIGLELAKQWVKSGARVTVVCRKTTDELKQVDCKVVDSIDVTSLENLKTLATKISEPIDLLINNAGVLYQDSLENISEKEVLHQFTLNTLAPIHVTQTLLKLLGNGSKVAHITSRMGSISDNSSGGFYGYRMSKAALNAAAKSMAIDLKPSGVSVGLFHPGYVKTKMTGFNGDITPEESASGLIKQMKNLNIENSGGFWHSNGQSLPW